jgi:acetyl-CoA carboxylase/biotin carboxylase 1
VDPVINHNGCVEMYCDATARGGILEPAGVVEIKFRDQELRQCMRRNDPSLQALDPAAAEKIETSLLPLYNDIARQFADLHDTPGRMKATGCVVDVIPWKESRRVFYGKLVRKMKEVELGHVLVQRGAAGTLLEALLLVKTWFLEFHTNGKSSGTDETSSLWLVDEKVHAFLTEQAEWIQQKIRTAQLQGLKETLTRQVQLLKRDKPQQQGGGGGKKEGNVKEEEALSADALRELLAGDPALRQLFAEAVKPNTGS